MSVLPHAIMGLFLCTLLPQVLSAEAPDGPEPEPTPAPGEFFITAAEREHWAFQPIDAPPPPECSPATSGLDNPIDAFNA